YARVLAIEEYLSRIPYTLTPPVVPEGADFVDYFLFEEPEGYCVYFASAMAVLLRSVGIPARYREGYLLPPERVNERYEVSNEHAHAWAEAYLEGYGWLNVEATAPFILTSREQSGEQSAGAGAPPFTDEYDYYDYMRYIMGYDYPQSGRGDTEDAPAQNAQGQGQAIKNNFVEVSIRIGIMLLALAAAVAAVFAYTLAVRFCEWFKLKRLRKLPKNEQACAFYGGIARIASNHSYPRLSGETPLCYGRRLKGRFTFNNSSLTMGDLGAIYYRAKYGGKTIGKNELQAMRDCYLDMTELIREAWGPRKYLRMRYLKGVFIL
ncbi:MAG: transglutaminase-like domain-containing protein, partial [Defluviitaleaceae bacterium]|nr:transglutaminase-like domain-containing protein [Defluviitaleaceae bacterium]